MVYEVDASREYGGNLKYRWSADRERKLVSNVKPRYTFQTYFSGTTLAFEAHPGTAASAKSSRLFQR